MKKEVIVIAAISQNGVYGVDGAIPWRSKLDMAHFKQETTGHTVVMGRKTWESLPEKFRPLPDRENIIVSRSLNRVPSGVLCVGSLSEAITAATSEKVFCIGGASVWYEAMNFAQRALVTIIGKEIDLGQQDTKFASGLLIVSDSWQDFSLDSVRECSDESLRITFCRWVR